MMETECEMDFEERHRAERDCPLPACRVEESMDCAKRKADRPARPVRILVSACLMGASCRYDGADNGREEVQALGQRAVLVPFCPEIYGGLMTPRMPSEIRNGGGFAKDGRDVTHQYMRGAAEALKMAQLLGCSAAVLKERSPSCGSHQIYDGTFTGTRIDGMGVTARLLAEHGLRIFSEEETEDCLRWIEEQGSERR